ncbi:MAG: hypothetical protein ACRYGL_15430 [Janthinobacterium lividum]
MLLANIEPLRLSSKVLPADARASFDALPIRDRLIGIATFAHIGDNIAVRDAALAALRVMDGTASASSV